MESWPIELNDMSDEILLLIFEKMNSIDVLYSFIGVNKRFNKLVHDSIFTNHLTMTRRSSNNPVDRLDNQILDRFCSQILPEIHHKIKWLDVEFSSMEVVLLCTNYPNLYGLSICNIEKYAALRMFTDETRLTRIFQEKISSLVIDDIRSEDITMRDNMKANIFACILNLFSKLEYFHYKPTFLYQSLFQISPTIASSTLLELHIKSEVFTDCLYILDGRFDSLERLYVDIYRIFYSQIIINNKKQIDKLKVFSLCCEQNTDKYYELIVPLIRRMINLEELDLHLKVHCENRFIDGHDLKNNIINHLLQLNRFVFNIRSRVPLTDQVYLLSNEECQLSFKDFLNKKIISYVDYFLNREEGQCLIYSYPYQAKYYEYITNNFRDGWFKYVREVSLYDERPFEHEFFIRISKSFPFMSSLTINNNKPQNNKFYERSKHNNEHLSVTQYPYLCEIDLLNAHDDYAEQFLMDIKTCLTMKVDFIICFSTLEKVTHNFTRAATRINCAKIPYIYLTHSISNLKQLKEYFPETKFYC